MLSKKILPLKRPDIIKVGRYDTLCDASNQDGSILHFVLIGSI